MNWLHVCYLLHSGFYLRFNRINNITDKSLMGLRKLETLMLHGNDFHQLPDGAFTELSSLQVQ